MKSLPLLCIAVFQFITAMSGQQLSPSVIASDGGTGHAAGIQLEYTLGELAIDGLTGQPSSYTEGFHQPLIVVKPIDLNSESEITSDINEDQSFITVTPNPASSEITIHFQAEKPMQIAFQVRDAHGSLLIQHQADTRDGNAHLDLSDLAPGLYFIQCTAIDSRYNSVFKIIKI
jgi:hypothetical protein